LDIGLWAAKDSYFLIFFDYIAVLLAMLTVGKITITKPVLKPINSIKTYQKYSLVFFAIGYSTSILHIIFRPVMYEYTIEQGFGGFGLFTGFNYLGIIFASYANLLKSKGRRIFDKTNIIMLFLMFIEALISNTKHDFATSFLAIVLTYVYCRRGFPLKYLFFCVLGSILFISILTPAVQFLRNGDFKTAKIGEKVQMVVETVPALFDNSFRDNFDEVLDSTQNPLFHYFPDNLLVDRIEMIQDMDIIVYNADSKPSLGLPLMLEILKKMLPGFMVQKNDFSDGDIISFYYGTRPYGLGGFLTVGLFATNHAIFGWFGGIILTYLVVTFYYLTIKVLAPINLNNNIWGIFFMTYLWIPFSERSIEQLLGVIFRETFITVFLIVFLFSLSNLYSKVRR
jgi:hypothetical protein